MDKRLAQRHKRQVSRAKKRVRLSEPDLRTDEQIRAAREASRPTGTRSSGGGMPAAAPPFRNNQVHGTGSAAKTDG